MLKGVKMLKIRRIIVTSSTILLSTCILATPAKAIDITAFLSDIYSYLSGGIGDSNLADFFKLFLNSIESPMPSDGDFADSAENGLKNSYAIRQELANSYEINGILSILQEKNLGQSAQTEAQTNINNSIDAMNNNQNLANQSQTTDVSQQILQNISAQLGLLGSINQQTTQQITQTRQEQALNTVLTAQLAKQLSEQNTLQRREAISTLNTATYNTGLISLPGKAVLEY
jgi:hypothetical protein